MAKVFGVPSVYLRERSLHHLYKSILMALGGFSLVLVLSQAQSLLYSNKTIGFLITYTLITVVAVLAYKFYREDDQASDNYFRGREGERIILKELQKLPAEFRVFCDVKIQPPYNIDFVVAGPTGVFIIEVKSHAGKIDYQNSRISINGLVPQEKDFLKQAKGEARSVADYLKNKAVNISWVHSILAFSHPSATLRFGLKPLDDVFVIGRGFLRKLIQEHREPHYSEATLLELENILTPLVPSEK